MNKSRYPRLPSLRVAPLAACLTALSSVTAFAKDTITDVNSAGPLEVPPPSFGDFDVGGPDTDSMGNTVPTVDLILAASDLAEWWVNGSQSDPWTALDVANNFLPTTIVGTWRPSRGTGQPEFAGLNKAAPHDRMSVKTY